MEHGLMEPMTSIAKPVSFDEKIICCLDFYGGLVTCFHLSSRSFSEASILFVV